MKENREDIERHINEIVAENDKRYELLQADYDPITGRGLQELLDEERVELRIPDFPIPVQFVPADMMKVKLVKRILSAGSIENFLQKYKFKSEIKPEREDIIRQLRRIRHKYDFCHWAFFCIEITAKMGGYMKFKLNYAQLQVLRICLKMMKAKTPINIIIDKARQWGGSTFCIFFQFYISVHHDNFHSFAVAAHVQNAAHNILNMLTHAISVYPSWDLGLKSNEPLTMGNAGGNKHAYVIKDKRGKAVLPAKIFIGSAVNPDGLRSAAISGAHYSEVGVWPNTDGRSPEDLVADISGGIPKHDRYSMQVFESTAKTSDDYFHDLCYDAVDGKSNFTLVFIPFFFIPHDSLPIEDIRAFAEWLYTNRTNESPCEGWKSPGKYYWWLWEQGASLQSIQWYRYEEKSYTKRSQMVNEAPASFEESFQSSGQKVFDFYDVDRFIHRCSDPLFEGDLVSDDVKGADVLNNIRFISKKGGNLHIWEKPDPTPINDRYVVAVDIGGPNKTSDFSSVRVLDRLMMMEEFGGLDGVPNIVAEMHYHTDDDLLAYDAMRLAAWYNNALLVIESNTLETRDRDRDTGVEGFEYIMDIVAEIYGSRNLYARRNKEEDIQDKVERKWGFHTNVSTKPKIINHMKTCLRDDLWIEPSRLCCQEMSIYEERDKKLTAPPKKHDDVLMATAILLWVAYKEMPIPTWRKVKEVKRNHARSVNNAAII